MAGWLSRARSCTGKHPVQRNWWARLIHICGLLSDNVRRATLFSLGEPGMDGAFAVEAALL